MERNSKPSAPSGSFQKKLFNKCHMHKFKQFLKRAVDLYVDGFRSMTVGRSLWILIILKVILLVFVFKLIFFPNKLQSEYSTDADRAQAVRSALTSHE